MDYVCKEKKRRDNMIALAPVDGVTDCAFRQVVDELGKPDLMYTEFVTTEGLFRGRETLLYALDKHKTTTHFPPTEQPSITFIHRNSPRGPTFNLCGHKLGHTHASEGWQGCHQFLLWPDGRHGNSGQ